MTRPIDADELKNKAQKISTEAWKMNLTAKVETTLNQFIDWIDEQPTIDAVSVRHGKWINRGTYDQGYQVTLECECCGEAVNGYVQDYKYCPYCGAKMEAYEEEYEEEEE